MLFSRHGRSDASHNAISSGDRLCGAGNYEKGQRSRWVSTLHKLLYKLLRELQKAGSRP